MVMVVSMSITSLWMLHCGDQLCVAVVVLVVSCVWLWWCLWSVVCGCGGACGQLCVAVVVLVVSCVWLWGF